jgi:DNA-binding CsgD family transcriptional regulator
VPPVASGDPPGPERLLLLPYRGRSYNRRVLLGRERERAALEALLVGARGGRSGALALVGEAGIGKTALLAWAEERAGDMCVLRARGIQPEARIPFAGLFELLRPVLDGLGRIPPPQARALESALALRPGRAQDRFAVGAATLSLLAARAEEEPVAVLVDDAHWLDESSADALLFALRRLLADPVAVVLAVRAGEPSLLDGADLPTLELAGLDAAETATLLGLEPGQPGAERLHRETGGNPLALVELAAHGVHAEEPPPVAPVPVVTTVAHAYLRRVAALPERTQTALLLATAAVGVELAVLARAAARLGVELDDLEPAESAGLLGVVGGRIEFRHPLVRSAVYGDATAERRREVHRALADSLPDADRDRRAWNLALAAIGPDDAASSALQQAGLRARDRSAYVVASRAFEHSARLAPDEGRRAHLLLAAADAAWLGGLAERADELLDEVAPIPSEPALTARARHLRGNIVARRGPVMEGHSILRAAAEGAAAVDPELAMLMLADAAHAALYAGEPAAMQAVAARAEELVGTERSGRTAFFADIVRGMALVFSGEGRSGADALRAAVERLERSDELREDPRLLTWAAMGPLWLREAEVGRELVTRALAAARSHAAVGALPILLNHVSIDQATADRWAAAEAGFDEAMRLARETGQRVELASSLSRLAWLAARQGRGQQCRAYAAEALELTAELGLGLCEVWTHAALADLALGEGRPEEALVHLERQAAVLASRGIADPDISPAPELVDVHLRLGRPEDAEAVAAEYRQGARTKGQPWALARSARVDGLLAPEEELDTHFRRALDLHAQTLDPFEACRTRLAYGSRLRRARRRADAREHLRAAIGGFDELGAGPWADLAQVELAATGETARRRDPSTLGDLTPQEVQIGLLLAEGRTTREAAAALFLSPKTIEYHLRNVYRKLGIRSREELTAALAEMR